MIRVPNPISRYSKLIKEKKRHCSNTVKIGISVLEREVGEKNLTPSFLYKKHIKTELFQGPHPKPHRTDFMSSSQRTDVKYGTLVTHTAS